MIIAKEDDLLDVLEENIKGNKEGKKEDFPFGYTNRAGDFVEDLSAYIELMSPINTLIQNSIQEIKTSEKEILETNNKVIKLRKELKLLPKKNKAKNAKIKKGLISLQKIITISKQSIKNNEQSITKEKIDSLIVTEVKKKTNTKLGDTEILNTFKPMYVKAKKSSEGERTRDLKVKPKVEGEKYIPTEEELKVINRKTSIKYEDRDIKPTDKSKFIQIILQKIVPTPTVEEIENAWEKLLAGEDMGFDSTEELEEIKAKYQETPKVDTDLRKILIRLSRKSKVSSKTEQKKKYNSVVIAEFFDAKGTTQKMHFLDDTESEKPLRPFKVSHGSLIISLTHLKMQVGGTMHHPRLETAINTWMGNNGYNPLQLKHLLNLVENLFGGSSRSSLEGKNNEDFYDNIWEMQTNIKETVDNNIMVDTVLDKTKMDTINKNILKGLELSNNFSLEELGKIIVKRPEIEDKVLRDNVINFIDTPVNNKTYGYFILRAIATKVPYRILLREAKPTQKKIVQDLRNINNKLKKSMDDLNSKQRRKVKTYLQDADPTEYFGEEYLKLGKLINILDEVEGSTGELEGLEEDNLKMIKVAASLRKKYENLYRKLREKVYPEEEEE